MDFLYIVFLFLVIGVPIIFTINQNRKPTRPVTANQKSPKKNPKEKIMDFVASKGVTITKEIFSVHNKKNELLVVDDENKNIVYAYSEKKTPDTINVKTYSFKDVLNCELINDSRIESFEAFFSVRERRIREETVYKQGFRVTVNDINNPCIDILLVNSNTGVKLSYQNFLKEWISIFQIVMKQGKEIG